MAFKKLESCDSSDMVVWAGSIPSREFLKEVAKLRCVSLRRLIKEPTEQNAAEVRAFDKVSELMEEARNLK